MLSEPRKGDLLWFSAYPDEGTEWTLGDPESVIWASIRHLCSRSAAEFYARKVHGLKGKNLLRDVAANVRLYIQQASEFYHAAGAAKPNTAPLIYYYSFLNLAKALCEFRNPGFHGRRECYSHGLSWRPDPQSVVNFATEGVTIERRGVWHVLWETLTGVPCPAARGMRLSVMKLFSYLPEVSAEYGSIFGGPPPLVELVEPVMVGNSVKREVWLKFSVSREYLRERHLSGSRLVAQIKTHRSSYVEVRSKGKEYRTYESSVPRHFTRREGVSWALRGDILDLNLVTLLGYEGKLEYNVPLQDSLPVRLPQLAINYTLLFWMGSLVRYDPHSVYSLMDSIYWVLVDGFMSQSRIWMLELFRWALYQKEIRLRTSR